MIIVSNTTQISELAKVEHLYFLPQIFGKVVSPLGVFNKLQIGQLVLVSWLKLTEIFPKFFPVTSIYICAEFSTFAKFLLSRFHG